MSLRHYEVINAKNLISALVNFRRDWSTRFWAIGAATAPIRNKALVSVYNELELVLFYGETLTIAGIPS